MPDPEVDAVRHMLASSPRPTDLTERRKRIESLSANYTLPADVQVEPVMANGVPAEWTTTPEADPAHVVMFLHGGAYISGSLLSHRHLVAQLGREAKARTLALNYRLAPEHPFPAALEDTMAGYRYLLSCGYAPEHIAFAGESAGGGLAVAALVSLRDAGVALPACVWLSSPWVDLEMTGETMTTKASVDPLIQKPYLLEAASAYLHGANPRTPLASPLYADLSGLPPMLIQVGTAETLLDDSTRFARSAAQADLRVTLETWPDMIHAWTLFYPQIGAARRSLASAGVFVHLAATPAPRRSP
jgi:epsilon-lactone hydrolase